MSGKSIGLRNPIVKHTFVACEVSIADGIQQTLVIELEAEHGINISAAIASACSEYCQTKEGRKVYESNNRCFNWGDFDLNVPNSICEKYGFRKTQSDAQSCLVDFNEQLFQDNGD